MKRRVGELLSDSENKNVKNEEKSTELFINELARVAQTNR